MSCVHHPERTFVHLGEGPEVALVEVTPDFWETIDRRATLHRGRLVTSMTMSEDWGVWEMHPHGDELIMVTEGTVHFHLDDGLAPIEVTVPAPEYVVVPSRTWHTADARGPARLVVVTWGAGTRHRPR